MLRVSQAVRDCTFAAWRYAAAKYAPYLSVCCFAVFTMLLLDKAPVKYRPAFFVVVV